VHLARGLAADPVLLLVTHRDVDARDQPSLSVAIRVLTRERRLERVAVLGLALEDTLHLVCAQLDVESVLASSWISFTVEPKAMP
jgi:hypothetical protein